MERISEAGYTEPTPIQSQAIPQVLSGVDVMGLAQTGTGKTAAFVLPILQRLLADRKQRRARALILAPTRELAEQIHQVVLQFAKATGIRSAVVYGGVSIRPQVDALRNGAEVIVACPGRLLDHMRQRTVDLRNIEILVLDEADQMFDMGFLPSIRQIVRNLPRERQTLLFSATMPTEIRSLANEVLKDPVTVQIAHGTPTATVAHALYHVEKEQKPKLLLKLISAAEDSVLVFTRTKHQAKRLGQQLERAGINATSLQGNLSQNKRQRAMDGFRQGKFQVLVATDIAARGIDVASVRLVINFDIPSTPEAYTHRIGRTGRAAQTGEAFTFVSREDSRILRAIERALGKRIECREAEGLTSAAPLASQIASDTDSGPRQPQGQRRRFNGRGRRPMGQRPTGPRRDNSGNRSSTNAQ
ncbi:MAG: DEAD/DEAH box helicase [Bdellovibrionota bacterium]